MLCELDFPLHAFLGKSIRRGYDKDLGGSILECLFKQLRPILPAPQLQNVGPDFVAERRQPCSQPQDKLIVLRRGVADEHKRTLGIHGA
jgi:hypothetical protein